MPFDLDLSAAQPLLDRVSSVFSPTVVDEILLVAGRRAGLKAEEIVGETLYPPASGKPLALWYVRVRADGTTYESKFKSLKQQRKVMMLVKQGRVPYKRSGDLGRSIVSRARLEAGVLVIDIGSRMLYSPYVIDRKMQSHYHIGTWKTVQDDFEEGLPQIEAVAVGTVVKEVNRRING
jgi:hypothetical protein